MADSLPPNEGDLEKQNSPDADNPDGEQDVLPLVFSEKEEGDSDAEPAEEPDTDSEPDQDEDNAPAKPEPVKAKVLSLTPKSTGDSGTVLLKAKVKARPLTPKNGEENPQTASEPVKVKAKPLPLKPKTEEGDGQERVQPLKVKAKAVIKQAPESTDNAPSEPSREQSTSGAGPDSPASPEESENDADTAAAPTPPQNLEPKPQAEQEMPDQPVDQSDRDATTEPEEDVDQPEPRDEQDLVRKPVRVVGSLSPDKTTVGQILQEYRVRLDLSINQVEQVSKIKKDFIEALERDDFENLPPFVYVNAYVKKLCNFYEIDEGQTEKILHNLKEKNISKPVSEEILQHIEEEKQVNMDEELKIKRMLVILSIAATIVIIAVALAITFRFYPGAKPQSKKGDGSTPAPASTVEAVSFEQLENDFISPRQINMTELDVPKQ